MPAEREAATQPESGAGSAPVDQQVVPFVRLPLASAPKSEREALDRLLKHASWARRAIAIMRLERFSGDETRQILFKALVDPAWQVRVFALRALARGGETIDPSLIADETEPRVIRAALRFRMSFDATRLGRGIRVLARSSDLEDKMLAVELAAASGDEELIALARETCKTVILKMDRVQAGVLSSRLAAVTGQKNLRRFYEWKDWLMRAGRKFEVGPAFAIAADAGPQPPSFIAQLESDQFTGIESYMAALGQKELDLAILIDCTASMFGEIAAAQAGVDDMMRFVCDIVASARIAIVGYRDDHDDWETRFWDFTGDIDQAREQLWTLTADGGGDFPEAVFPAMKLAFTKLAWRKDSTKVLVLVGDAPPHVGLGTQCVDMAQRARDNAQVTTHAIEAEGKEVKHFPEIAKAGGGRCVTLDDDDALMAEVTGLTLADRYEQEFREFFQVYLELCR